MQQYAFVLGRYSSCSFAEITSFFHFRQIQYHIEQYSTEAVIVSLDRQLTVEEMRQFGGVVKIGEIVSQVRFEEEESAFVRLFTSEQFLDTFSIHTKKIHIGISVYHVGGREAYVVQCAKQRRQWCLDLKRALKPKNISVGFVQMRENERYLSSVSVARNKLLTHGAEILLFVTTNGLVVGKTIFVQEFWNFSRRDMGRPERDKRSGILPPKLARMMLNIAGGDTIETLLDPFCGSGTILQEATLLKCRTIIGSDVSTKAVEDATVNLNWLSKTFSLPTPSSTVRLEHMDVRTISKHIPHMSIQAIVTEPYLGPRMQSAPSLSLIQRILSDVKPLYSEAFREFSFLLKPRGIVVIVFPAFFSGGAWHVVDMLPEIHRYGFSQQWFTPIGTYQDVFVRSMRGTLLISGHQFLQREILSFQKHE